MFNSLQDILDADPLNELIEPFDLTEEDVSGKEIVPIVTMGIFNPMGPTIVALNLLNKADIESAGMLFTMLNPFSQKRQLFARCGNDPISLTQFLPNAYQVGEDLLLGSFPDFVLPSTDIEPVSHSIAQLIFHLVNRIPSLEELSETTAKIKENWQSPWKRIPSFEDMINSESQGEPQVRAVSETDFDDWFQVITNQEHWLEEIRAIMSAWKGAIQFQGGNLPYMPFDEVVSELASLGHPFFESVKKQMCSNS